MIKWDKNKIKVLRDDIFSGGTPDTRINEYWNGSINWLSSGETREDFIFETEKKISESAIQHSSTRLSKRDDVLVATAGQGKTRGQVSYCMVDTYINQSIISIRTNKKLLDPLYLFYFLKNSYLELRNLSDSNSSRGSITCPMLDGFEIFHPSEIIYQNKIAKTLKSYDDLIMLNNKRIKILEEMAQLIYREWFVKFKFPGYENVKMKDGVPEGWEEVKVEDALKRIQSGRKYDNKTAKPMGKVPILDQGRSGIIGYHDDEPGVIASEENPIIVFANHTCYQNLIMFPFSAIQNILPFYPSDKYKRNIFWLHWATKDLIELNDYKGHWPEFVAKKLLVPSADVCEEFGELIKPMFLLKYKLERLNNNLRQTRDLLLSKLMSGEIEIR